MKVPEHIEDAPQIFTEMLNEEEQQMYLRLDAQTLRDYKELFEIFDQSGDGHISVSEIDKVMQALGQNPGPIEIQKMITKMDWDKDG